MDRKYNGYLLTDTQLRSLVIDENKAIVQSANLYNGTIDLTNDIIREQTLTEVNKLNVLPFEAFEKGVLEGNLVFDKIYYLINQNTTVYVDELGDNLLDQTINFIIRPEIRDGIAQPLPESLRLHFEYKKEEIEADFKKWTDKLNINVVVVADNTLVDYTTIFGYVPKSYTEKRYFWKGYNTINMYDTSIYKKAMFKDQLAENPNNETKLDFTFMLCNNIPAITGWNSNSSDIKKDRVLININGINSANSINNSFILETNSLNKGFTTSNTTTLMSLVLKNCLIDYTLDQLTTAISNTVEYSYDIANITPNVEVNILPQLVSSSNGVYSTFYFDKDIVGKNNKHVFTTKYKWDISNIDYISTTVFNLKGVYQSGDKRDKFDPKKSILNIENAPVTKIEQYTFNITGVEAYMQNYTILAQLQANFNNNKNVKYSAINIPGKSHRIKAICNMAGNRIQEFNTEFRGDGTYISGEYNIIFQPNQYIQLNMMGINEIISIQYSGPINEINPKISTVKYTGLVSTDGVTKKVDFKSWEFKNSTLYCTNNAILGYFLDGNITIPTTITNGLFRPNKGQTGRVYIKDYSSKINCFKVNDVVDGVIVSTIDGVRLPEYSNIHTKDIDGKSINLDNAVLDFGRTDSTDVFSKLLKVDLSKEVLEFLTNPKKYTIMNNMVFSSQESQVQFLNKKSYSMSINASGYENLRSSNIVNDIVFVARVDIDLTGYYFDKNGIHNEQGELIEPNYAEDFFVVAEDRDDNNKLHICSILANKVMPSVFTDNNKIVFDDGRYYFKSAFQIMKQLDNNITNKYAQIDSQRYDNSVGMGSFQFLDLTSMYSVTQYEIL